MTIIAIQTPEDLISIASEHQVVCDVTLCSVINLHGITSHRIQNINYSNCFPHVTSVQ